MTYNKPVEMYPKGCVSFFVRKSNPRYKIKRGNALPEAARQRPRRGGWAALHGRAFDPGFAVCVARRAKVLLTGRLVRGSVEREKKLRKIVRNLVQVAGARVWAQGIVQNDGISRQPEQDAGKILSK